MKRIALLAFLLATPAIAADKTVVLTDVEQQQLLTLLDLAAKQGGLNAAAVVAYFANKIRTASESTPSSPPHPEPEKH